MRISNLYPAHGPSKNGSGRPIDDPKLSRAEDKGSGEPPNRVYLSQHPTEQHSTARTISISICLFFFFFFKLCVSVSLSMEALSSPLYLTPRPRHSCPLKWCSSGSVLLFPPCLKTPAKHNNMGIIKASVAVEQQTQKNITALVRIGTRGRYSFSLLFSSLLQLS